MMEGTSEDAPVTLQLETCQYIRQNESLHALVKGSKVQLMYSADVFIIQHTKEPPSSVILGKLMNNATADDITNVLQKVSLPNPKCMKVVSKSNVQHSILQTVVRQLITVIGVEKLELNNPPQDLLLEEVSHLDEFILDLSSNVKCIYDLRSIEDMVKELLIAMPTCTCMFWRPMMFVSFGSLCQHVFELLVVYFLLVDVKKILLKTVDLQFLKKHILQKMHYSRHRVTHFGQSMLGNVSLEYICSLLEMDEGLPDAIMSDFVQKTLHSIRDGTHSLDSITNFSSNFTQLVCIRNKQALNDLPDKAWNHVTRLYLNGNGNDNSLGYFPSFICGCCKLKVVCLNCNDIGTLPNNISDMVSMRQLALSHNDLRILPQSIGDCLRLTILQIDHNKLEMIPDSIGNLSHLEKFNASSNKLKVLPPSVCRCTELTYINIANNMIHHLPLNIGNLVKVEHFDLQGNNISCLPVTFDRIKALRKSASKLLLEGNPLIHPPIDVCLQGMYRIHTHLKELRRSDAQKMNYQRLVLVGETMSGKTSLAQTLMANSSQLTRVEQRTVVLEQQAWPAEGGIEIQINDFGGHEMYHLTSPCFFTPDATYLLIFDINNYTPQDHHKHMGSWMDVVRMKVPRANIRMVGTHKDKCSPEEIKVKLQYIAKRVGEDEVKWRADITSQLEMIEHDSNECLAERARQKQRKCLQSQLENLPILHEPGSPVEIRTVSSSDFSGIDSLSSYIRELCKHVGSNGRYIPKIWFDLHEMLQSEKYDNQHWISWKDLQLLFSELLVDNDHSKKLFNQIEHMGHFEYDSDSGSLNGDSDSSEEMTTTLHEEPKVTADVHSCVKVMPCCDYEQETNAAAQTDTSIQVENKGNNANAPQPTIYYLETEKSRGESMGLSSEISDRLFTTLQYLKAVGLITWYPDDEKLQNLIFHRPAKLVDIFKAIVNHDIKNQLDFNDVVFSTVGQFSKQSFAMAVQEFESTANLSVAIVECLWHKLGFSKEDTKSLIKLMIKFDICYEVLDSKVAPGLQPSHRLHIPWYLSADPPKYLSKMWPQPPPDDYQQLTMQYHFPTFCPRGLFERASVRLHQHIAQRVNWKNGVWAVVDSRQILLTRSTTDDGSGREEVFTLSVRAPVTKQQPGHTRDITLLWTTFLSIHRDMRSLIQEWPGLRCDTFLQCAHCVKMGKDLPSLFPGEVLEQQCGKDVWTIPCPQYPMTVPVQQVRAELVYPPNSCLKKQNVACPEGLASETTPNLVSEMDRLHLGNSIDTLQLQQATALVQKKYPGISFIPSRDTRDEAQRRQRVREFHDQLSRRVQHFSSVIDYSIDYEDFPTITERMKSVAKENELTSAPLLLLTTTLRSMYGMSEEFRTIHKTFLNK
ncbi:malignant fibrous histiocytoma-amplified sequence 1 homolog [Branchiostoma floridae]|uniref:Malignant fibrous histiocytoma-amplified sequence 1 homolog n=1 Tax=Branchiostoma floridae TaxID=7739 RepID=A0A9J7LCY0_BRAFL|nr:malignant fibrous histiocytoma-amplified sequence 1 homolog [Branchiostoma floridae]